MALEITRFERWIKTSFAVAKYEPFMTPSIQGLGKLDALLIKNDEGILKSAPQNHGSIGLTDQFTQSWLWVLGGYEIVRTISKYTKKPTDLQDDVCSKIMETKKSFARIRMPLAKFEAEKNHKTDSPMAYPVLNTYKGIAWQVAPDCIITRRDLSDELLGMLESIKESQE